MSWQEKRINTALGVILAVLCLAVLIALSARYRAARDAAEQSGGEGAPSVQAAAENPYVALICRSGKTELSFSLDERQAWRWDADPDFPLDDTHVLEILSLLETLEPTQTLERGDDLSPFGLASPRGGAVAVAADGSELAVDIGGACEDGGVYADINRSETAVYVIPAALWNALQTPIYDMCRLPQWDHPAESAMTSISVQGGKEADAVVLTAQKAEGDETSVTWRSGGANVTDVPAVRGLLADLAEIAPEKCVDFRPSEEAASLCGFDDPVVLTVRYVGQTGTDDSFVLEAGEVSLDGSGRYVRVGGEDAIYLVSLPLLDPLTRIAADGLDG